MADEWIQQTIQQASKRGTVTEAALEEEAHRRGGQIAASIVPPWRTAMQYENSAAFRRAMEERLRQQSVALGTPLARLRDMVALERLLAQPAAAQPDAWVLKGGLALQRE